MRDGPDILVSTFIEHQRQRRTVPFSFFCNSITFALDHLNSFLLHLLAANRQIMHELLHNSILKMQRKMIAC